MTTSSSDAVVTACEARIIKQVEYYFGDVSLSRNNFLKEKIQEDDDGWLTIGTMLKFNGIKKITDNAQMICEALKKSSSGLMEVSKQGDKIRQSPSKPLPGHTKETREEINARTVYAKPFPLDVKLNDLLTFFQGYGQLDNVFMKEDFQKKTFKGSVFVTFANKEDAAKFVNEEETKFKEQAVVVKWFKTKYCNHKAAQKKAKGKNDTEGKPYMMVEDETKEEETKADLEERVSQMMSKNAVLHLKGLNSMTSREQVLAHFSKHADVVWIDFNKCATEDYIIIREPDIVSSMLEKSITSNDGKVVIRDSAIEVRVVEGDEELQYWKKIVKDITDTNKVGGRGRRHGGINQRGGRNHTDGRRNSEGPQGKRNQNKNEDSDEGCSDGEVQDIEEPAAKVIISEMVVKFDEVLKFKDASCHGEGKKSEDPPGNVIKSEKVITRPQSKRKQNRKDVSSDGEEHNTEEPPAKVIKSAMVKTFQEVMKLGDLSSYGENQDTEEPLDTDTKSEKVIIRPQGKMKQNKNDASSDVEEQDTEEPPAKVFKYEKIITSPQGKMKQNNKYASSDVEEQDTEKHQVKVIKYEKIIPGSQRRLKQNKKDASSDGEEEDNE